MAAKVRALRASTKNDIRAEEIEILKRDINTALLKWGVVKISGMVIDGALASVAEVILQGPEELVDDLVVQLQKQLALSEQERKN